MQLPALHFNIQHSQLNIRAARQCPILGPAALEPCDTSLNWTV